MSTPASARRHCVSLLALEEGPWEEGGSPMPVGPADLGGKAASLQELADQGFPVLPGVVLLPSAFPLSQQGEAGLPQRLDPRVLRELRAALAPLARWVRSGFAGEAGGEREVGSTSPTRERLPRWDGSWAVRSSLAAEDGGHASHAGLFTSVLSVASADLEAAILQVWQGVEAEGVAAYRRRQLERAQGERAPGERGQAMRAQVERGSAPPAVLIQPMLRPCWAGVAFSADPVQGHRGVTVVEAVPGLADRLLAGQETGELWRLDHQGSLLEHRPLPASSSPGGLCLPFAALRRIGALTRRLGRHRGHPQDVEWALLADGSLWLLQCRPITTLRGLADPDGALLIWDNSNIVESYGGVTTPLTFSFARKAYSEVYAQFCRFMGVPASTIRRHHATFAAMIGFLEGRIYYNLLSWYRVLALLPGYRANARFLEQMLGVKEPLPAHQLRQVRQQQRQDAAADPLPSWLEAVHLGRSLLALVGHGFTLTHRCRAFRRRLDRVLLSPAQLAALAEARPDELVQHYRRIEADLLSHWDAPLINDFYAMVFYGVLRALVRRWAGADQAERLHDWLAGDGQVISAEPPRRIEAMAAHLASRADLVEALRRGSPAAARRAAASLPALQADLERYLNDFGDRCLEELKLETQTLREDPLPLLRSLGAMAWRLDPQRPPVSAGSGSTTSAVLPSSSAPAGPLLPGRPLRCWLLQRLVMHTRALLSNRENLRFERTRVFGLARRLLLELGRRYQDLGLLERADDVLFLEVEEVLGLVEARASGADPAALAAVRREDWQRHQAQPALPRRLETRGLPGLATAALLRRPAAIAAVDTALLWQGIGCAPGLVRGRVSLVLDPRRWLEGAPGREGSCPILVAAATDPGWVLLFPHAAGLLVERGSVLSHVAIVARELGLPMVTELGGISTGLADGDWVEMDGRAGTERRLPAAPVASGS